jgi:hypothetical protein
MIPPGTPERPETCPISVSDPDEIPIRYCPRAAIPSIWAYDEIFGLRTQLDGLSYLVAQYTETQVVIYQFVGAVDNVAWFINDLAIMEGRRDQVMAFLPSYLIRNALA